MDPLVISRRQMNYPGVQHTQELFPLIKLIQEVDEQYEAGNFSAGQLCEQIGIIYHVMALLEGMVLLVTKKSRVSKKRSNNAQRNCGG